MDTIIIDLPFRGVNKNKEYEYEHKENCKTLKRVRESLVFHLSVIDSFQNGYAGILLSQIARKC